MVFRFQPLGPSRRIYFRSIGLSSVHKFYVKGESFKKRLSENSMSFSCGEGRYRGKVRVTAWHGSYSQIYGNKGGII